MSEIYVAGHTGLVGSAICRRLRRDGVEPLTARSSDLDLTDQRQVNDWFEQHDIEHAYLAAARVGGIGANSAAPAVFIHDNLAIQTNVIHAAWASGVRKLGFLGSSCIYPRHAAQPIREDSLMTGPLESTNESYAVAKIAGLKMCQAYREQFGFNAISLMPTNLYGPRDNFDLETSHVLPALIRKFHDARQANAASVVVWGTGKPQREFLHVDDLADAAVFLMATYDESAPINVGSGAELSIADLAVMIGDIVGFAGEIEFDTSRPDGTPRKLLDVSRIRATGWRPKIDLRDGLSATYSWYLQNVAS